MRSNIFITGFSGSGKTTVAREVARRLGWRFVDTDEEIVRSTGKSIEDIFTEGSESRFRDLERECLERVCEADRQVVSTGGGMPMDADNRRVMERAGAIVCLEARPETIHQRLSSQGRDAKGPVVRPMLLDSNPSKRILALKSKRQFNYSLAHWTVHTDHLDIPEVAAQVVEAWRLLRDRSQPVPEAEATDLAATVRTLSGEYPVWVGWGTLGELGERVGSLLSPGAAYVITDEGAYPHGRRAQFSLEASGVPCHIFIIPSGERSKTLETAEHIYGWLAGLRAERGHLVVAVGGGVVGDLAGFVAATYLRGVLFGQVPTTLLAMMDAAIGGKTGVDLPGGKNLVGAFHQPRFVLADVQTLETLPKRDLSSGWVEAIKHGLILDESLLSRFEEDRSDIVSLDRVLSTEVIRRSVAIKADVVSRDEKETLGVRVLLNYGHTIGHAIEAATGYGRFLHGEAVSVGMMGAALIGNELGLLSTEEVERHRSVLEAYGVPVAAGDIDLDAVRRAMAVDKKTGDGALRWVLLDGIGHAMTRNDVPEELVDSVLGRLSGPVDGADI